MSSGGHYHINVIFGQTGLNQDLSSWKVISCASSQPGAGYHL